MLFISPSLTLLSFYFSSSKSINFSFTEYILVWFLWFDFFNSYICLSYSLQCIVSSEIPSWDWLMTLYPICNFYFFSSSSGFGWFMTLKIIFIKEDFWTRWLNEDLMKSWWFSICSWCFLFCNYSYLISCTFFSCFLSKIAKICN